MVELDTEKDNKKLKDKDIILTRRRAKENINKTNLINKNGNLATGNRSYNKEHLSTIIEEGDRDQDGNLLNHSVNNLSIDKGNSNVNQSGIRFNQTDNNNDS